MGFVEPTTRLESSEADIGPGSSRTRVVPSTCVIVTGLVGTEIGEVTLPTLVRVLVFARCSLLVPACWTSFGPPKSRA